VTDPVSDDVREQYAGVDPAVADQQLNDKLGIEIVEFSPERVVGTMPAKGNLQPYGILHGGANAVLAEALGSWVAALHAGPGRVAMGLELSCTHHRAVRQGMVTGVIALTDDQGLRTCSARLTCVVRDRPPR
jgi:uncharacterized protein (TIGR00369 family)